MILFCLCKLYVGICHRVRLTELYILLPMHCTRVASVITLSLLDYFCLELYY